MRIRVSITPVGTSSESVVDHKAVWLTRMEGQDKGMVRLVSCGIVTVSVEWGERGKKRRLEKGKKER